MLNTFLLIIIILILVFILLKKQNKIIVNNELQAINTELKKYLEPLVEKIELLDKDSKKDNLYKEVKLNKDEYKQLFAEFQNIEKNIISLFSKELNLFSSHISSQDKKLERYEEGYNKKILSSFYSQIFRILDFIKKTQKQNYNEDLFEIEEDLFILLKNSGIQKLDIKAGDVYTEDLDQYVKIEQIINTTNTEKDLIIKEIKRDGYIVITEKYKKPIRAAKIIINKFIEESK